MRVFGWLGVAGFAGAALTLIAFDFGTPWSNRIGGTRSCWFGAAAMYATALRPSVDVCDNEVVVRRYLSTVRFPTSELTHATAAGASQRSSQPR